VKSDKPVSEKCLEYAKIRGGFRRLPFGSAVLDSFKANSATQSVDINVKDTLLLLTGVAHR
jgi:hypothetical protein